MTMPTMIATASPRRRTARGWATAGLAAVAAAAAVERLGGSIGRSLAIDVPGLTGRRLPRLKPRHFFVWAQSFSAASVFSTCRLGFRLW
jgi:hypothetical protein